MSNNAVVDQLAALLEAGTDAGAFSLADPKLTAIMMFNALHGAADAAVGGGTPLDKRHLIRRVCEFCEWAAGPVSRLASRWKRWARFSVRAGPRVTRGTRWA